MIKKTINYKDFNGTSQVTEAYFGLSKAELAMMQMTTAGGLEAFIQNIVQEKDISALANMFRDLILKSYGKKSLDGQRFVKSPEMAAEFEQTNAYSELFVELLTNAEQAAYFVTGLIPADMFPEGKSAESIVKESLEAMQNQ